MRNPYPGMKGGGEGSQRLGVIAQREEDEYGDEFGVVDYVRSLGKINCLGQCAERTGLIENLGYIICKWSKSGTVEWLGRKPCWLDERRSE